ncbi:MAG: DNA polymerase III subunit beta [Peptoniphilaceae bacterium]|nr:DNA polymerase III subunit beta [Peptoniphilaceae bacterium]MDY6018911.1 DNA polymerase III subunit beta [Anaerococcus sp.]
MKLKINQRELLNGISIAQRAVSKKTNIQIHELIYFQAKDDCLLLSSFDGEIALKTKVFCSVEEEGELAVNANIIANIVRKLPDDLVTIKLNNGKITIQCEDSKFNIIAFDYYEKEDIQIPEVDPIEIDNDKLKRSIIQTEFATSLDETKLALTGILFELKEGFLNFVALDGYRVALKKLNISYPSDLENLRLILPKRSITEWIRIIGDEQITKIYKSDNDLIFDSDLTTMACKVIDKNYIDYTNIISDISTTSVYIDRKALIDSLERAQLLTDSQRANLIKISIEDTTMLIESNSEIGNVRELIDIDKEGDNLNIAFNAKYLLDGVRACDTDTIKMNFKSSLNPCLIYPKDSTREDEDYIYLALPVRLAN